MDATQFIISEKFIHSDLLERSAAAVAKIYDIWKRDHKIDPTILTWPAEPIQDDQGVKIEGVCWLALPLEYADRGKVIRQWVDRTKAYALLLVENTGETIKVILESSHGARCWTIPIHKSGDTEVLGDARITDNKEHVGLLWSSHQAQA